MSVSPTSSGKTSTLWMPVLWEKEGITLIISPLKALGGQHSAAPELPKIPGAEAVNLTAETATDEVFKVSRSSVSELNH